MNYLAHLYLSSHNDGLLTGNFIADAVKGNPSGRFPDEVVQGIIMHRAIDDFTDKHPATKEAVELFRPQFGRYAPVLLDVLYDYLLSANWQTIEPVGIDVFAADVYARLGLYKQHFPGRMPQFYEHMVQYDFLTNYGNVEGITKTLDRLQIRAKTDLPFAEAMHTLENEKGRLHDLFLYFFTQLQTELERRGYGK